jgi:hypothetical protein
MTEVVKYTETNGFDSAAVEEAYYDENTKTLTLKLYGGVFYRYSGVPLWVYEGLLNADSAGKYYHTTIQPYGPAQRLGTKDQLQFQKLSSYDYYDDEYDDYDEDDDYDEWSNELPQPNVIDTRKTNLSSVNALSLNPVEVDSDTKLHQVVYTVAGHKQAYTFETRISTVGDAVFKLRKLGEVLGLEFDIRSVTVYFE